MNNMKIRNKNLALYLGFKLKKIGDEFTVEELSELKELAINQLNDFGEYEEVDIEVLDNVPNVETLTFRNYRVTDELIERIKKLKNLKSIMFERCLIDDFDKIGELDVEHLSITKNCNLRTDFLRGKTKYKSLFLTDSDLIDIENLKGMDNLETLYISNSDVKNPEDIGTLGNVSVLHIENTNIEDISFMRNMEKLRSVGIDKRLYISCNDVVNELEDRNVEFLENGFIPLTESKEAKM